ncbi:MAG TPA: DNA gyrase inhibitor YacG [Crenotrichaceae bacterium]|nr:DNA gyrase inhibitor YacG [Crenotrichaceae bacterium]
MKKETNIKIVLCPTCKKQVQWVQSQQYRPFCCERCKLIDLGDWASEGHRIPGTPVVSDQQDDSSSSDY